MKIEEIDKNFAVNHNLSRTDIKVYDVCGEPFSVHGLILPENGDDRFRRMPEAVAKTVSEGVYALHAYSSGGRVRFKTDSKYIAIVAKMSLIAKNPPYPVSGSAGFDLYTEIDGKQHYVTSFIPKYDIKDNEYFKSEAYTPMPEMREYTLNLPYYSSINELKIVLMDNAELLPPREYKYKKPIVYYGSSITEGACASRPGNTYEAIISRELDCDFINLGFSGQAKGEKEIAEYISGLDMSIFVYDYDHNAPDAEHLRATHKPMFDIIRKAQPDLPIICVSAPIPHKFQIRDERRKVIMDTVNEAKASGDKNVYFIDGADFNKGVYAPECTTVDGVHPTDYGFSLMAKAIGKAIEKVLFR